MYKNLVEDLQKQLDNYISTNEKMREDIVKLKKSVGMMALDVCTTPSCQERTYLSDIAIENALKGINNDSPIGEEITVK